MKPITISPTVIAREAGYFAACFAVAFGANIFAVIYFHRPALELFSQLGYVVVISLILYVYILVVRGIYHGIKYVFNKIKTYIKKRSKCEPVQK